MMLHFPSAASDLNSDDPVRQRQWTRDIAAVANRANQGKINAIGNVTLTASSTTTTLTDPRLTAFSYIDFMPITANAATAKQTIYITGQTNGLATLNHTSNTQTDRTYTYLVIG